MWQMRQRVGKNPVREVWANCTRKYLNLVQFYPCIVCCSMLYYRQFQRGQIKFGGTEHEEERI